MSPASPPPERANPEWAVNHVRATGARALVDLLDGAAGTDTRQEQRSGAAKFLNLIAGDVASIARSLEIIAREAQREGRDRRSGR